MEGERDGRERDGRREGVVERVGKQVNGVCKTDNRVDKRMVGEDDGVRVRDSWIPFVCKTARSSGVCRGNLRSAPLCSARSQRAKTDRDGEAAALGRL